MTIATRVKETGTTTSSDVALLGAVAGFDSFSDHFQDNFPIAYMLVDPVTNDWEHGRGRIVLGFLKRDTVARSSNAGAKVNFSGTAGGVDVFCALTAENNPSVYSNLLSVPVSSERRYVPSAGIANTGGNGSMPTDKVAYIPFKVESSMVFDGIGIAMTGTGVGSLYLALYSIGADGLPDKRLIYPGNSAFDTGISGFQMAAFPAQRIPAGKYFAAIWTDISVTCRTYKAEYSNHCGIIGCNYEGRENGYIFKDQTGLTDLPDPAIVPDSVYLGATPIIFLEPA